MEFLENEEGERDTIYVLNINGHKLIKYWNAICIEDKIFKTKEGLGVGSSLKEFDDVYGKGTLEDVDGGYRVQHSIRDKNITFDLSVSQECFHSQNYSTANKHCKVKQIWM
jgi:hypothetical protein